MQSETTYKLTRLITYYGTKDQIKAALKGRIRDELVSVPGDVVLHIISKKIVEVSRKPFTITSFNEAVLTNEEIERLTNEND